MDDVQSRVDDRGIPLDRVGVTLILDTLGDGVRPRFVDEESLSFT